MIAQYNKFARQLSLACLLGASAFGLTSSPGFMSAAEAASIIKPADRTITVALNKGTLIKLDRPAANVFIANPAVADVQVKSPTLMYIFGTGQGETTFYAVGENDQVIFSANVAVANNIDKLNSLVKAIVPDSNVQIKSMNGMVILTGFVEKPEDAQQLAELSQNLLGDQSKVINRLQIVTPTQVNLRVKFVEVTRDLLKNLGINWQGQYQNGSSMFGLFTGRGFSTLVPNPELALDPALLAARLAGQLGLNPASPTYAQQLNSALAALPLQIPQFNVLNGGTDTLVGSTSFGNFDVNGAIDALEGEGYVSILAEPNLTAVSGETATFLAGGEFPIPVPDDRHITISFKQFGVGLAFTPTVLSDDRISLRVRPEVSQLSADGSVNISGFSVPAISTRRAETTVELGSGQSFAIAGLLQNNITQNVRRLPGLGNLPIIGALFKSDRFRNQETELVIIVTPYLVKPTHMRNLSTPLDGKVNPTDIDRYLRGDTFQTQPATGQQAAASPNTPKLVGPAGFSISN